MKNISTRLSVQFSLTGLSFCIQSNEEDFNFHTEQFDFQTPGEVLERILLRFREQEIILNKIDSVLLIHQNEWSSFVPKAFFDESHLADYLQYNIALLPTDYIAYDVIANHDMVNVYLPYVNINNYFLDHFSTFQYKHHLTVLTGLIINAEKNRKHKRIFVHFNEKTFDLIVLKNGKLQLCNQYHFETAEDVLYYLLFVSEQIGFSDDYNLLFLGNTDRNQPIIQFIRRYISKTTDGKDLFRNSSHTKEPAEHLILLNQHA